MSWGGFDSGEEKGGGSLVMESKSALFGCKMKWSRFRKGEK
jgi:hypothetical protein